MKSVLFAVAGFATAVVAQTSVTDLAQCGQTCANNMLGEEKSTELGCSTGDLKCLCANPNFLYGIRDCSNAICGSSEASQAVQYGINICQGAGVAISTSGGSNSGSTKTESDGSKGGSATVSTIYSEFTSGGTAIVTPIATTTFGSGNDESSSKTGPEGSGKVSTFTRVTTNSVGDKVTTVGETTISGSGASKTEDVVLTTFTSSGSTIVETVTTESSGSSEKSASETGDSSATATEESSASRSDSSSSETSGTSSDNAGMPQKTAAPLGAIAAAGLAIFLL